MIQPYRNLIELYTYKYTNKYLLNSLGYLVHLGVIFKYLKLYTHIIFDIYKQIELYINSYVKDTTI